MLHTRRHLVFTPAVFAAALGVCTPAVSDDSEPRSTIVFASTREDPAHPFRAIEIYLMDVDGTNPRRLTDNTDGDFLPALSPDGRGKIVFDSNRLRAQGEPLNTSDLFLMNHDGTEQTFLTRGSSATWSPVGPNGKASKNIAFHASATGTGQPIKSDPGAATEDSDIFVVNVDDLLEYGAQPQNITNTDLYIEDDADWSPDGEKIAFTRHGVDEPHDNSTTAEIYVLNMRTGELEQLTRNKEEERAPAWSPDGTRIAYVCRRGPLSPQGFPTFEICLMDLENLDSSGFPVATRLTENSVFDAAPHWSPDGKKIVFSRMQAAGRQQVWVMDLENLDPSGLPVATQLTDAPGTQLFANWGVIEVGHGEGAQ